MSGQNEGTRQGHHNTSVDRMVALDAHALCEGKHGGFCAEPQLVVRGHYSDRRFI
jgi:hypothetical protein